MIRAESRSLFLAALALVVVTTAAYLNSFSVPFLFDDLPSIVANPTIRRFADALHPPPNGATVYVETAGRRVQGLNVVRPLKLSAHSSAPIAWYVDGQPLKPDADGEFDWSPPQEGFYDLIVANDAGQSAKSHVRVVAIPTGGRP